MNQLSSKPTVVFDSIIYGLQEFGGISNYWDCLTSYAATDCRFETKLLLPRRIKSRVFEEDRIPDVTLMREDLPVRLSRYLSVDVDQRSVFHTSYYRPPRRTVRKYIVTVYDFIYERYRSGLARWAHHRQKLESIRRADEVICISEFTRRDVLEFCPEVNPVHVHVVPLAVDLTRFFAEPVSLINQPNEVLFVGQRQGYKRFDLAVEAVRQITDLNLGIVGPALTVDEHILLQSRLPNRWIHHGAVSVDKLRHLYACAFCFVFPSDYEGFGLPTLEAMACGCPVISSKAASLPEVGGAAALYAESQNPDDYAQALISLRQPGVRAQLVSLGLARSEEFNWQRTSELTFKIYGI
jgi:mannosyltransferase